MNPPEDKDTGPEPEPEQDLKATPWLIVLGFAFLLFGVIAGLILSSATFK